MIFDKADLVSKQFGSYRRVNATRHGDYNCIDHQPYDALSSRRLYKYLYSHFLGDLVHSGPGLRF
jgi:hypothetical protein